MPRQHLVCVYVPDFRLHVAYREWGGEPMSGVALVDPEDGRRRIAAASPQARLDGVVRGMVSTLATTLAPDLWIRTLDRATQAAEHAQLEARIRRHSPKLETTGAGVIYVDFRGLERRYAETGVGGFLDDLRGAVLNSGFPVRLGLASTRFVARAAAILQGKLTGRGPAPLQIPFGEEALFLAPLPLELLPDAQEEIEHLHALGIRSLGAFADLPDEGIARRLGPRGLALLRLARGEDRSYLLPAPEPKSYRRAVQAEAPVVRSETLTFLLRRPLEQLLWTLDQEGLATRSIRWTLELEGKEPVTLRIQSALPSASLSLWTDLLRLRLESWSLPAPATAAHLEAEQPVPRPAEQERWTGPRKAAPGALSRSLAHLVNEVGCDRLGANHPQPHRWPELRHRASSGALNPEPAPRAPSSMARPKRRVSPAPRSSSCEAEFWVPDRCKEGALPQALRWEDPPLPIEIATGLGARPVRLRWRHLWRPVQRALGPWDLSDGGWASPQQRRYFQLEGRFGTAQVVQDLSSLQWFLWAWLD